MKRTKDQKVTDAEERNLKYFCLTDQDKLNKLNRGKFRAAKQRKKLGNPEIPADCIY